MSESKTDVSDSTKEPKKDLKFSYFEPIAGIIISLAATIIFLIFPHIITVVFIGGQVIPTFDVEVIRSLWVMIPAIIWAVLRVGVETAYLVEHRYTKRLANISVIGNALAVICSCIIFIPYRIVYWEFIEWVHSYFASVSVWFGNILARPNLIILVLMIVVLLIESITVVRKGNMAGEDPDEEKEVEEA